MNIFKFLNKKYSIEKAAEWDPVGFSFYFRDFSQKTLICLDLTPQALKYALDNGVDTILTHHPFIFASTLQQEYAKAPYKRAMVKAIKKEQINVFALHTNFDSHSHGTAYHIIKALAIKKATINRLDEYNLLVEKEMTLDSLLKKLKAINLNNFSSNINLSKKHDIKIQRLAILPGAGGIEATIAAKKAKADLILTSDLKWSDWISISNFKKQKPIVLEVSHLIESAFIDGLKKVLTTNFPKLKIFIWQEVELKFVYQIPKEVDFD